MIFPNTPVIFLSAAGFLGAICITSAHVIIIIKIRHPFEENKGFFACHPQRDSSQAHGVERKKTPHPTFRNWVPRPSISAPASSCTRFPDVMSLDGDARKSVPGWCGGGWVGLGGREVHSRAWPSTLTSEGGRPSQELGRLGLMDGSTPQAPTPEPLPCSQPNSL